MPPFRAAHIKQLVKKPRRVSPPQRRNQVKSVFPGDMCVGKNTSRPANVRAASLRRFLGPRANSAKRFAWGEEAQGSARSFRHWAETERSGLCADEVRCRGPQPFFEKVPGLFRKSPPQGEAIQPPPAAIRCCPVKRFEIFAAPYAPAPAP